MDLQTQLVLGFGLLLVAIALSVITILLLRSMPRFQAQGNLVTRPPIPLDLSSQSDSYLLVQGGGRILYISDLARQWFNLREDVPNLERLINHTRPTDTFISLCAKAGQATFTLDGRAIEGASYEIPYASGRAILVALRMPQIMLDVAPHALSIFSELSQSMASSLELERTAQAILESIQRLVPADFAVLDIWQPDSQRFTPCRITGSKSLEPQIEKGPEFTASADQFARRLIEERQPVLFSGLEARGLERLVGDRQWGQLQSYLGMPLEVAGNLVGAIELATLTGRAFSDNDQHVLRILSGQAGVALQNALRYEREQRRAEEMQGLAHLARAAAANAEPQDLYARLVESISPLLVMEVLGFLIYDENSHTLKAEAPFQGLTPGVVEWSRFQIQPSSPGEAMWLSQQAIVSNHASDDPRLVSMGLHKLATFAGADSLALVPLTAGGRPLGYLLAADKRDGSALSDDDLRLLEIIAGQAAPIIDNARLILQSRQRAQRAETLRRIASLTASTATLDELLKYSLLDLARLLQADYAAVFLVDEGLGELRIHRPSLYGVDAELASRLGRLPMDDPQFSYSVAGSQKPYLGNQVLEDPRVLPLYRPIVMTLEINSAIVVPMLVRTRSIGEIMLGSKKTNFFVDADLQSVITAGGQLAGSIERATLYTQTDESLRRRVDQLTAVNRVSRELNSTLELPRLLRRVFDEALQTTQADCGTILLFELRPTEFELEISTASPPPKIILHLGDEPGAELHPLELSVLANGQASIVEDFTLPVEDQQVQPAHNGVRSALLAPIAYKNQVAGLIHLHSRSPGRFDSSAREIVETLSIQAAIALGNANRYQEEVKRSELLNRRVATLARLFETTQALRAEQPLEKALENIVFAIQSATPFSVVVISVYNPQTGCLERLSSTGLTQAEMDTLRANPQPWSALQTLLQVEYHIGRAYFIPYEKTPVVTAKLHTLTVPTHASGSDAESRPLPAWHPEDILILPLLDVNDAPLGAISVDAPRNNLRPDHPTIETLEIFGSQASLVIENQQKRTRLEAQLVQTRQEMEQSAQKTYEAVTQLPLLLQKDQLQTQTLQKQNERVLRLQAAIETAEAVNRQPDRTSALLSLGRELAEHLALAVVLIVEPSPSGPRLLHQLGAQPAVNLEALLGQRNPLTYCLQTGENVLVSQLSANPEWVTSPLLQALQANAFISLAVASAGCLQAAVLATSNTPLVEFTSEDQYLFTLLLRQVDVTLQHLNLLSETSQRLSELNLLQDFNRNLGSLDTGSIMQTLVHSARHVVSSAQACMAALWDSRQEQLEPQAASGYDDNANLLKINYRAGESLPGRVFQDNHPVRVDELDFAQQYNLPQADLLRYRDATAGRLPISCMVLPIHQSPEAAPLGVIILDNFQETDAFDANDQALITALAQQTALHLENIRLVQASQAHANQMQALNKAAAAMSAQLEPNELIETLLDQLRSILPYNTGTLWLRQGDQVSIQAARGFGDDDQRLGVTTSVEDSALLSEMIATCQSICVNDVRSDARFPSLVDPQHLSWLGVPLVASGEVMGVIALEKSEPEFYTPEHIQAAATFSSQAAVALENARLFQVSQSRAAELDQRTQRLEMLNRLTSALSSSLDPQYLLKVAVQELHRAISCLRVSAVLFSEAGQPILSAEAPETARELPLILPAAPLYERLRESLGVFNTGEAQLEPDLQPLLPYLEQDNVHSLMAIPLATGIYLLGLLLVQSERTERFNPDETALARTIANQAAIALQNARLYAETHSLSRDLEQRVVERTAQLAKEHQRTELLLRISTELTTSLDLEQVLNRTLVIINQIVDAGQITVLIARPGERKLHRLASLGYTDPVILGGKPTTLSVDEGLAGWVLSRRQSAMIDNVLEDPRWILLENTPETQHRSAMAVPLMVGADALGVLLLYHQQVGHFTKDQLGMVHAAANQVAVAINNAELYRLIRDQAEDLGNMFRSQQVEASRSRAMLEAVADGVLVTDADRHITLFNPSAERILQLKRPQVIGKSLENFVGLFGRAGQAWMETIQNWTRDPRAYQPGSLYSEQIALEDGRVVSVHLSPVSLRDTFLGTVSVFRDITYEVELDRLKSEFVATVSHELRTPMTSIKGYVDIMLLGAAGQLNEQQQRFLEIVKTNTERLAVLVNDLLDISRIEAGRAGLALQTIDLQELAQQAVESMSQRALSEGKPMQLHLRSQAGLPQAYGDPDRVRQILDNLLENAYTYSSTGGQIEVCLLAGGEEVQVDVQDNGIGIAPELQERVFERFYRGDHPYVLATSGTGLGLAIVRSLVEMQNGRIWLQSSGVVGEGSRFSFTLPAYRNSR